MPQIDLIIQARLSSSRLRKKVLLDLEGKPVLQHVIERAKRSSKISSVVICTTTESDDDNIVSFCREQAVPCYRGSTNDVLDRYYQAALLKGSDIVVRCTSDCPLLDPHMIDNVISYYEESKADYVCFRNEIEYCDGFDVEVFSFVTLEHTWRNATSREEREHVTAYMRTYLKTDAYVIPLQERYPTLNLKSLHLSLDTESDYRLQKQIFKDVYRSNKNFGMHDVLEYLNKHLIDNTEENDVDKLFNGSGQKLYEEAKYLIPGGTQLLSKRPEMFLPNHWPSYYRKTNDIEITTLDGVKLKDFSYMSVGACVLGYNDPDVNRAVHESINRGMISTLNCPSEVELTKLLCEIHPWASMARYTRGAGEACALAVRIARAASKKDKLAFCGYHGWHDWYLAANINDEKEDQLQFHLLPELSTYGVPQGLKNTAFPFRYNHIEDLEEIIRKHDIGTIIMEVQRSEKPKDNFLQKVRDLATKNNIILVFDEITSCFRVNTGGLHLLYDVDPDIAIFGKALGNGFPIAAVIGKREYMTAAEDTFISSTFWTEDMGPSAALACIRKFEKNNVGEYLQQLGTYFQEELRKIATEIEIKLNIGGLPALVSYYFDYPNKIAIKTLYTQKMLERHILATCAFYLSFAHRKEDVDYFLRNIKEVFSELKELINTNQVESNIKGPISHSGLCRLT